MLKKITEPQAVYSKAPQPGQPVNSSFTTPPKKKSKFNWKIAGSIIAVCLIAVVGVAGVLIAQRQAQVAGPVAPNAPESQPLAAIEQFCSLGFEVTGQPITASKCISKSVSKVVGTNKTPLTANAKVARGDKLEYTITVLTSSNTQKVNIADKLPTQLTLDTNSVKVDKGTIGSSLMAADQFTASVEIPAGIRGQQIKLTYTATVKTNATIGNFTNAVTIFTNDDQSLSDNSCKITLAVATTTTPTPTPSPATGVGICEAKVALNAEKKILTTKGTTVSSVKRGDIIEYKLTISAEKQTKGSVVVTDTLPAHLSYQAGTATGVAAQPTVTQSGTNTVLTFTLGTMATAKQKQTIVITYKAQVKQAAAISSFTNAVRVVTAGDNGSADTSCKAALTVAPEAVAQCASKTVLSSSGAVIPDETTVTKGTILTYRIKVTATETTKGAVAVSDTLPASVTYDSAITPGLQYDAASRRVTMNLGVMGDTVPNREKLVEFKVKVNDNAASGDFTNIATVTTDGTNANACQAILRIAYACDVSCETDAQCQSSGNTSLICSQEAGNKCRLASNTSSQSCQEGSTSYSCNSSCQSDAQCQTANSNYVCTATNEGDRCRHKDATTSSSCQLASTPTPTPAIGCNQACTTNADCSNPSHICYTTGDGSQLCRLDTNPASATCSTPGTPTTPGTPVAQQPDLPEELPQTGPEDWVNWLKAGLITLGIGAVLLLLL